MPSRVFPPSSASRPGLEGLLAGWPHALVLAVAMLAYANTLSNGFVFDDHDLIVRNPKVQETGRLGEILTSPLFGGPAEGALGLYRPVLVATFWLDARWSGGDPAGYHFVNLVIHAANSLLLYGLALSLGKAEAATRWAGLLAALLFAVHPVHADAVSQISGRSDLLASLAMLGCLALAARAARPGAATLAAAAILSLGAGLCKEIGLVLPVLLLAVASAGSPPEGTSSIDRRSLATSFSRRLPLAAASLAGVAICLLIRSAVLGPGSTEMRWTDNPLVSEGMGPRAWTALAVLGRYVGLLVFPLRLSVDYAFDSIPVQRGALGFWVLLGALALAATGAALLRALRGGRDSPLLPVAGALFLVPLLPVINFPLLTANLMAERYLYLPSAGFCLLVGWLFARLARIEEERPGRASAREAWRPARRRVVVLGVLGAAVLILGAARTLARNRDFRDDFTLFTSAERVFPRNVKVLSNLAYELVRRGEHARALELLQRAVSLAPDFAENLVNLGNVYAGLGRSEEALSTYRLAASKEPGDPLLHRNMGSVLARLGRGPEAIEEYEAAVRLDPHYWRARLELASLLVGEGRWGRAYEEAARLLEADPGSGQAALLLSQACRGSGDMARARDWALQARKRGYDVPEAYLLGLESPAPGE